MDTGVKERLWRERYDALTARGLSELSAPDLELLAEAAFWLGRPRDTIAARQRAYAIYRDAQQHEPAARMACRLFHNHFELDELSAASGWLNRAQGHLREVPDSSERGYVAIAAAMGAAYSGQLDEAIAQAALANQAGIADGDRDLAAWGLAAQSGMRAAAGDISGGVALLDDAMVETVSGELTPFVTGWIYCFLLKTCQAIGDVGRAGEWTDAAVRWCEQQGVNSWYPGVCRLHRCEITSLRGEWASAEREALRAAEELAPFGGYLIAEGLYLAGEIRGRRGDYAGAEDAFLRAHELGHDAQPGLALIRLARHDVHGAAGQLRLALLGGPHPPMRRVRLLAASVRVALELGDIAAAEHAVSELADVARTTESRLAWALLGMSHGALLLAKDDVEGALPLLRESATICTHLNLPYECAQDRMLLGHAARRAGDEQTARLEFESAEATFRRLGAIPDAARAAALAHWPALRGPSGLSEREVEVLRLLASGLPNRDIAAKLVISEHTVRRHLSNIYRKTGVPSRTAATAFAIEHGLA
jgi:DNA-binding CsgD family transcriptional regulator/tetratricopeptide (TPR) repeat protein